MQIKQLFPGPQDLQIKDGAGQPTQIVFRLVGRDSKEYRDASKKASRDLSGKADDLDLLERTNAELTASFITGWSGLEDESGAAVPYSKAKAVEFMMMPELNLVREQVEDFVADRANFFRRGKEAA